ncbi:MULTISPECIES: DUF2599 domain-containing protein [unclassified Mycobacterium]|uniref:DUF2599 domain-containing protein n=1 Tax=unclassified Mycobacterium TaxID=2642494 RepID=UPI0029C6FA23|nr:MULTISPECIES: DUF2599 domain-containing protein [unclassified Mycobacterium]
MKAKRALAATITLAASMLVATPAHGDPPPRPPGAWQYIDHVEWVRNGDRSTLRIFPTYLGWLYSGVLTNGAQSYDAWNELLANAPDANTQSMLNQFLCYWQMSSLTNPGKIGSWKLEPWRPIVTSTVMVTSVCNPGGPDDVID